MSARKIDTSSLLGSTERTGQCLTLSASEVTIRKSGIEFRSARPMAPWTELTVSLHIPHEARNVDSNGVIVACSGDESDGYLISMLFTNLSRQSQARLNSLANAG